jgi:hypothetical protein
LKSLEENPINEAHFFDALYRHRKGLRDRIFHYLEYTHADVMLYPTCPLMPLNIDEIHGPDWTIEV